MKRGFTLIELLVVVLIIGILSAIALPQYTVAVEKSRLAEALTTLNYMQKMAQMDYMETGGVCPDSGCNIGEDIMELSGGEWNEGGTEYCTKHFLYTHDDGTFVSAVRTKTCGADDQDYELYMGTPWEGEGWEERKDCSAFTDLGYKICQGLAGQGFNVYDDRQ